MKLNSSNKTHRFEIRLTEEEKRKIENKAKKYGFSVSDYVRKASFETNYVSKTDIKTVFELKKIGVNLNQLAKHINSLPLDENIKYAIERIEIYMNQLDEIKNTLL